MGLQSHIILIGLMGAGKTTVGKLLARELAVDFVDCDHEIVRVTGVDVATIFEIEGEDAFRKRESAMLAQLVERKPSIIATGGGAVIRADNRRLLRQSGRVIYLHAKPATVWDRIKTHRGRPLLETPDPLQTLMQLYEARDAWYRETAHVIVEVGAESPATVCARLREAMG